MSSSRDGSGPHIDAQNNVHDYIAKIPVVGKVYHDFDIDEIRRDDATAGGRRPSGRTFASLNESSQLTARQKRSLAFAAEDEDHEFGLVYDEKGRRRFHGAFTGGFSAGYFNTVGSREGWKPTQFTSSRSKRALTANQRISDIADEEDLLAIRTLGHDADTIGRASQRTESSERAVLGEQRITYAIQDALHIELAPTTRSIGEKLSAQLLSHLNSGHPDWHTDDRAFQVLYKRIKLGHLDTFSSAPPSSSRRVIGPQIIPEAFVRRAAANKTEATGQEQNHRRSPSDLDVRNAVGSIRNYFEAESTLAVLHILRTAHLTTPLRLLAAGGKPILSLPSERWVQGTVLAIESSASILPTQEIALVSGKSVRELVAIGSAGTPNFQRSELSLISTIDEQPVVASSMRRVMRREEGRFPTELSRGRVRDVPAVLPSSLRRNKSSNAEINRSSRNRPLERNALAAAGDDDDADLLLADDAGGYDFDAFADERPDDQGGYNTDRQDPNRQDPGNNGEDELGGQSYSDRVSAKIKRCERSYRHIPGFTPPTNLLLLNIEKDWERLKRFNQRAPHDFDLRNITPRMAKLSSVLRKNEPRGKIRNDNTGEFPSSDKIDHSQHRVILKNKLAERFTSGSADQILRENQSSTESKTIQTASAEYDFVRANFPLREFISVWTPSKLLCKMLNVSDPIPSLELPSRQKVSAQINEYFTSLRNEIIDDREMVDTKLMRRKYPFTHRLPHIRNEEIREQAALNTEVQKITSKTATAVPVDYKKALAAIFDSD